MNRYVIRKDPNDNRPAREQKHIRILDMVAHPVELAADGGQLNVTSVTILLESFNPGTDQRLFFQVLHHQTDHSSIETMFRLGGQCQSYRNEAD